MSGGLQEDKVHRRPKNVWWTPRGQRSQMCRPCPGSTKPFSFGPHPPSRWRPPLSLPLSLSLPLPLSLSLARSSSQLVVHQRCPEAFLVHQFSPWTRVHHPPRGMQVVCGQIKQSKHPEGWSDLLTTADLSPSLPLSLSPSVRLSLSASLPPSPSLPLSRSPLQL